MKKFLICLAVFISFTAIAQAGWTPIPGVDIPIDPGAFWAPDVPDYADDGNVYSRRMLASGTVIDHTRAIKDISVVANLATFIQNQLTNLKKLDSPLSGLSERFAQLTTSTDQASGSMKPGATWNNTFIPTQELESGYKNNTLSNTKTMLQMNDKTYQDALRQAQISQDNAYVQSMIQQVGNQNLSITGNLQGKQNNNQGTAIGIAQAAEMNQINGFILSTILSQQQARQQDNAQAYQNAKGMHVNVTDPYNPKPGEPTREASRGFTKF